ncbi:hypothetical protein [Dyella thiooxydans]|uniref:hypothetical protein n=1 Tax=Dyella thiooxydans TaxID=445710 RepID=UPI0012FA7A04|nr:hypothetical protein [Dyella thiooxydans]
MQINFYMADEDRRAFHDYLFSRGAYLAPDRWSTQNIPLVKTHSDDLNGSRKLKIFKSDLFPESHFQDPAWVTWHAPTEKFVVHGPGIEYLVSFTDANNIHRGRLYMGLVSPSSFVSLGQSLTGAYAQHQESYRALENFYKSCVRYIRKNYRKDSAGFYHGEASDTALTSSELVKVQA